MAKILAFLLSFVFCLSLAGARPLTNKHCHPRFFNVLDFGAKGNGHTDDSKAFQQAWKATCKSPCSATMYIPNGKQYLLQPVTFSGPCRFHNITVQIEGELVAPENPNKWKCESNKCNKWITFHQVKGLTIEGHGSLNGRGEKWWNLNCKHDKKRCGKKATGLVISHSEDVHINNLRFRDSPQMHVALERSDWVYVSNITIDAPWDSPNTDGIHLQHATHVHINDSIIRTGDDCISISDGSSHVDINNITCGPGHGISIGSLGINGKEEKVEFVHVNNVTFHGSTNGVRIKTWQGGKGYARHITFENIISVDTSHPIIIDQYYCPHKKCSSHKSTAVEISDVTYRNIKGTSKTKQAITIACSEAIECSNISMEDINLVSSNGGGDGDDNDKHTGRPDSYCSNAELRFSGEIFPPLHCSSKN